MENWDDKKDKIDTEENTYADTCLKIEIPAFEPVFETAEEKKILEAFKKSVAESQDRSSNGFQESRRLFYDTLLPKLFSRNGDGSLKYKWLLSKLAGQALRDQEEDIDFPRVKRCLKLNGKNEFVGDVDCTKVSDEFGKYLCSTYMQGEHRGMVRYTTYDYKREDSRLFVDWLFEGNNSQLRNFLDRWLRTKLRTGKNAPGSGEVSVENPDTLSQNPGGGTLSQNEGKCVVEEAKEHSALLEVIFAVMSKTDLWRLENWSLSYMIDYKTDVDNGDVSRRLVCISVNERLRILACLSQSADIQQKQDAICLPELAGNTLWANEAVWHLGKDKHMELRKACLARIQTIEKIIRGWPATESQIPENMQTAFEAVRKSSALSWHVLTKGSLVEEAKGYAPSFDFLEECKKHFVNSPQYPDKDVPAGCKVCRTIMDVPGLSQDTLWLFGVGEETGTEPGNAK